MAEAGDIAQWIGGLADPRADDRAESARNLYLAGLDLCRASLDQWRTDPAFRELVCAPQPGSPRLDSEAPAVVVGVAVHPETFEKIRAANDSPQLAEVPPDQDAKEFELRVGGADFDILTTREPGGSGAIARYLRKFGEGIQQIEVCVTRVDRATEILRERFGLEPVYPATRAGADGTRVNFFLAPAAQGNKVLIELVEDAGRKPGVTKPTAPA